MAEERTNRDAESREVETRTSDSWIPASVLPTPAPQDGWVFRWVRTSTLGQSDATNVSQKFREGWVPVKQEDHPELEVMSDIDSRFKGNIEIGGLLLCKQPEAEAEKRKAYYEDVANNQMASVDNNFLKQNDPRMPVLKPDRSTRTTFGRG